MYCSHCGKKVNDTMLFCPFCGDPIVIPDQDEPAAVAPAADSTPEMPAAEPVQDDAVSSRSEAFEAPQKPLREMGEAEAELLDWDRSRRTYSDDDLWSARGESAPEDFAPLNLEAAPAPLDEAGADWREDIARRKEAAAPEKKAPDMGGDHAPVRLDGLAPRLEAEIEGAKAANPTREKPRKGVSTLVPPKAMDPNDIFMDGGEAEYDAFDDFDAADSKDFDEAYAFEDGDEGSFFMRHMRGIVGLALFVILILMFVIYAFSKAGQLSLARVNLAWSTDAYTQLGYESYQAERYDEAGAFYERALQRDPDNYSYASSAAMAYVEARNTERAAAMLKRCAEISPTLLEPYVYLLNLYPDAAQRPWDITQLLQKGYERTGDARLNVTG